MKHLAHFVSLKPLGCTKPLCDVDDAVLSTLTPNPVRGTMSTSRAKHSQQGLLFELQNAHWIEGDVQKTHPIVMRPEQKVSAESYAGFRDQVVQRHRQRTAMKQKVPKVGCRGSGAKDVPRDILRRHITGSADRARALNGPTQFSLQTSLGGLLRLSSLTLLVSSLSCVRALPT